MSDHAKKSPAGYTRLQIVLHWVVFLLVALQFVLHEGIAEAWDIIEDGGVFTPSPLVFAHVAGGVLIGLFVLWRIAIKAKRGAPALPEDEPPMLKLAAHLTHLGLYVLLLLAVVSGGMAWFGGIEAAAEVHELFKALILLLVALHVGGALYQQFVLKSDIMARMKRPE